MKIVEEEKIINGVPIITCQKADNSKKPLVIISHGFTGNKNDMKKNGYLKELAQSGYYATAIDNRLHGDRSGPDFQTAVFKSIGKIDLFVLRKAIKETADDVRLLIDELSVLEEVDEDKIAMTGISMGGFITYRAIANDDRIKVGIPIISSPFWDDIPGDIPILEDEKMQLELKLLSEKYQPSQHLEKFYPTALLMQIGDIDKHYDVDKIKSFHDDLKKYYRNSPDKLNLIIYSDTKHEFKPEMWEQALRWLKKFL